MDKINTSWTVRQALTAFAVLEELIKQDKEQAFAFTGQVRIRFALLFRKLRCAKEVFDGLNADLIRKLGEKSTDEHGQEIFKIESTSPNMIEFASAQNELLKADSEIVPVTVTEAELIGPKEATNAAQLPVELIVLLHDVNLVNG